MKKCVNKEEYFNPIPLIILPGKKMIDERGMWERNPSKAHAWRPTNDDRSPHPILKRQTSTLPTVDFKLSH